VTGLGLSVNREWSSDSVATRTNNLEAYVSATFKKFKHISPKIDFTNAVMVYPSLTSAGRVRINYQLNGSFEIISDFYIDIQFYVNYDNQPTSEDAEKVDWGIVTSLSYSL
jgi:hypothetical protein